MKKILLIVAALASMAGSGYAADWSSSANGAVRRAPVQAAQETPSIIFGYCQGYTDGLGQTGNLQAAIEIPAETAKKWVGSQLTQVRIAFGMASKKDITLFLTTKLGGTAFYTQEVTIETTDGWNTVTLDTPYDIDGSKFFIGYKYNRCQQGEYPIGIDGVPTNSTLGDNIALNGNWEHIGSMFGNICIQAVISGDDLPMNDVAVTEVNSPVFVKPGEAFPAQAKITNQGAAPVENLDLEVSIGDRKIDGFTYEISQMPLGPGDAATIEFSGLSTPDEGINLPLTLTATAVNGQPDVTPEDNSSSIQLSSFNGGFKRNVVVEEWTGTWCGFCPRGIVGMAYMKETYGDDGFIGIGVHGDNLPQKDPMTIAAYADFRNVFSVMGYPGCVMNRQYSMDPTKEDLEYYYKAIAPQNSYVRVSEVKADKIDDTAKTLQASASVEFVLPVRNGGFSLAFVLIENKVGPFAQSNYYAGGGYGKMGGWEQMAVNQYWYYDEVARNIVDCFGISGSIPATVEANTPASYSAPVSTSNVDDINNCELIALVLDDNSGEIMNAAKVALGDTKVSAIESTVIDIIALRGAVEVSGDVAGATVYSVDGKAVGTLQGPGSLSLASGIYVVKALDTAGNTLTRKLAVK